MSHFLTFFTQILRPTFRLNQLSQRRLSSHQRGFTLIELLVTIAIIGSLSALLITNLVGARARAADARKKGELQQLTSALRLYYNDTQSYPNGSGLINPGTGNLLPGDQFAVGDTVYMKALPANYFYYSVAPNDDFILLTKLSNLSDDAIQSGYDRCCNPVRFGCPATLSDEFILCED
jgi:prepilin-type N-terminal cleavage/methylation domain-containing protein